MTERIRKMKRKKNLGTEDIVATIIKDKVIKITVTPTMPPYETRKAPTVQYVAEGIRTEKKKAAENN